MRKLDLFQRVLLLAVLIGCSSAPCIASQGTDLGVLGDTYDIEETDIVELIKRRIIEKKESGELDQLHDDMKSRAKSYARRPPGSDLPRASKYEVTEIVPQYTLKEDQYLPDGSLLYPKGTTVNPLKIKALTKMLCFIDADDSEQLRWAIDHCTDKPEDKVILTKGDTVEAGKALDKHVYFDQLGLVDRLGIEALPATLRQEGKALYVEEHPID